MQRRATLTNFTYYGTRLDNSSYGGTVQDAFCSFVLFLRGGGDSVPSRGFCFTPPLPATSKTNNRTVLLSSFPF